MRFLRKNAIALTALVFAMTGTGIAASRYIITSTSQIKPSVIKQLRGEAGASAATILQPALKGVHTLRMRSHLTSPVSITSQSKTRLSGARTVRADEPGFQEVPITNPKWIQYPEEMVELVGNFVVPRPTYEECGSVNGTGYIE